MCALVCEVPPQCILGGAPIEAETAAFDDCGGAPRCDPCQVPDAYPSCPPGGDCNCRCDCGDYSACCYQQPPRTLPIKPPTNIFRSTAPLETDTIYKRSYYACGDCQRPKPINPCVTLRSNNAPMEKCTVQKLSYMPPCNVQRTAPIKPPENCLNFRGPIYAMTSQKHDFVPKCYSKRPPIHPPDGICSSKSPLERCTVARLSYMPNDVCQNPPPKPIVQTYHYLRPSAPIEKCTVQKLSYLPVCLPKKECLPWAMPVRCEPPPLDNVCTTYKLSYIPNCNIPRTAPVMPLEGLKHLGTDANDGKTVYKLSYMPLDGNCCRPSPILPSHGLRLPVGKMEKCTVQKLSYQPNACVERTRPIRPKENCLKPMGVQYYMTTQKHDFVPKPRSRRPLIIPPTSICRPMGGLEKCTVNKLSYMPVDVCAHPRPAPITPLIGIAKAQGPMEKCTTYKLSYVPNCPQPKEYLPWAHQSSYVKPTAPIEKCTIQKLSYGPPGTFSRCGGCSAGNAPTGFPKAGIC